MSYAVYIIKICPSVWVEHDPKKPKHVTCHVFAETTHVVTALPSVAWVVVPLTWLYILFH